MKRLPDNPGVAFGVGRPGLTGYKALFRASALKWPRKKLVALGEHEFGHIYFWFRPELHARAIEFFNSMTREEQLVFREEWYIHNGCGHPHDNVDELFASAFVLWSLQSDGFLRPGSVRPPTERSRAFWEWIQTIRPFTVQSIEPPLLWPPM